MKLALAFIGGIMIASFWYFWYVDDNTGDILALLKSREAHVGNTVYLPMK